jgi:hypothetical protein
MRSRAALATASVSIGPPLERLDTRENGRKLVAHRCTVEADPALVVIAKDYGRELFDLQALGLARTFVEGVKNL